MLAEVNLATSLRMPRCYIRSMLRYFPVSAPLMVIFGLLPWVTELLWLTFSAGAANVFLWYQISALTRAEAKSDADSHVYPPNWRPLEGELIFIFVMACFVGMFMLFAATFISALVPQVDVEQTGATAKGVLFTSSGVLLTYELSLPATKLEGTPR